jgi:hypothetical protein
MSWTKWKWACWSGAFRFSPASNHYNEALQSSIITLEMYNRPDLPPQSKVLGTLASHPVLHVHRKYPTLAWSQQYTVNVWTATEPITELHSWRELSVNSITVFCSAAHTDAKKGGYPRSLKQPKHRIATHRHNLAKRSDLHSSSRSLQLEGENMTIA